MKEKKDFEIDITKGKYHKTIRNEDNINTVDVNKKYTYYDVNLSKIYLNVDDKKDLMQRIKADLESIIKSLEKIINGRINDDR